MMKFFKQYLDRLYLIKTYLVFSRQFSSGPGMGDACFGSPCNHKNDILWVLAILFLKEFG